MGSFFSFNGICSCSVCQTDPDLNYEEGRRKKLKYVQHLLRKPDDILIFEKYIEIESGHLLFTKCYIPTKIQPLGVVFVLIGYATNIDRPDVHDNCLLFASNGYIAITHDHIGYGRSDGLWLYIQNTFDIDYVNNANYIHNYCKNIYIRNLTSHIKHNKLYQYHDPSIFNDQIMPWNDLTYIDTHNNYFICGRSMGGAVTCRLAMKYKNDYKGMILLCPMIGIDDDLRPPFWIEWIFRKLVYWFPKKAWTPSGDLHPWMVSTEKGKNKQSALSHMEWNRKPRLKTALEIMNVSEYIQDNMNLVTMDYIVLHGLDDKVTNPNISKKFYNKTKSQCDATIKLYDKSYHMLWWEPCADQVSNDMITWLDEKCKIITGIDDENEL